MAVGTRLTPRPICYDRLLVVYRSTAYATNSCEISQGLEMKTDPVAGRERSRTNFLYHSSVNYDVNCVLFREVQRFIMSTNRFSMATV